MQLFLFVPKHFFFASRKNFSAPGQRFRKSGDGDVVLLRHNITAKQLFSPSRFGKGRGMGKSPGKSIKKYDATSCSLPSATGQSHQNLFFLKGNPLPQTRSRAEKWKKVEICCPMGAISPQKSFFPPFPVREGAGGWAKAQVNPSKNIRLLPVRRPPLLHPQNGDDIKGTWKKSPC